MYQVRSLQPEQYHLLSRISRQLSNGGNNGVLDVPMVTDDSILDLVESLQGDFPDCISFDDDPFDFFPTSSPMTMR